jgi:hypothetical protein
MSTSTFTQPAHPHVRNAVLVVLVGIPAAVLAGSYLWLTLDHGTPALWNVVVHESGRYTLGQTILYFGHFLREVPIILAYALFLLGASGGAGVRSAERPGISPVVTRVGLVGAAALTGTALLIAARTDGLGSAMRDLLQYRTRDDLVGYGTHWRYHLFSTFWFGAAVALAPDVLRRLTGVQLIAPSRRWLTTAWLYVIALTLIFDVSADVFRDPRYIGHQAREIMTHGVVTLPLGLAFLIRARVRPAHASRGFVPGGRVGRIMMAGLAVGLPLYLGFASLSGSVIEHGQTDAGLGAMVAAHYFEHTLDYLLVLLLVAGGLALHEYRSPDRGNDANGSDT